MNSHILFRDTNWAAERCHVSAGKSKIERDTYTKTPVGTEMVENAGSVGKSTVVSEGLCEEVNKSFKTGMTTANILQ
jgi:hypothetical protein